MEFSDLGLRLANPWALATLLLLPVLLLRYIWLDIAALIVFLLGGDSQIPAYRCRMRYLIILCCLGRLANGCINEFIVDPFRCLRCN